MWVVNGKKNCLFGILCLSVWKSLMCLIVLWESVNEGVLL